MSIILRAVDKCCLEGCGAVGDDVQDITCSLFWILAVAGVDVI